VAWLDLRPRSPLGERSLSAPCGRGRSSYCAPNALGRESNFGAWCSVRAEVPDERLLCIELQERAFVAARRRERRLLRWRDGCSLSPSGVRRSSQPSFRFAPPRWESGAWQRSEPCRHRGLSAAHPGPQRGSGQDDVGPRASSRIAHTSPRTTRWCTLGLSQLTRLGAVERSSRSPAMTKGAFVEQHAMPTSLIAVLIVAGIVLFLALILWGNQAG
jgi:hypothetical protein